MRKYLYLSLHWNYTWDISFLQLECSTKYKVMGYPPKKWPPPIGDCRLGCHVHISIYTNFILGPKKCYFEIYKVQEGSRKFPGLCLLKCVFFHLFLFFFFFYFSIFDFWIYNSYVVQNRTVNNKSIIKLAYQFIGIGLSNKQLGNGLNFIINSLLVWGWIQISYWVNC